MAAGDARSFFGSPRALCPLCPRGARACAWRDAESIVSDPALSGLSVCGLLPKGGEGRGREDPGDALASAVGEGAREMASVVIDRGLSVGMRMADWEWHTRVRRADTRRGRQPRQLDCST
eukprot:scaffold199977_cov37-Tisochrysis_lutea.AAC.3